MVFLASLSSKTTCKLERVYFVSSPTQGRVFRVFCPKQGQDFKPLRACLYPEMGQVTPGDSS